MRNAGYGSGRRNSCKESKKQHYDPYNPPKVGKLEIHVEDGFVMKEIKKVLSSVDQTNIQNVVAAAGEEGVGQSAMSLVTPLALSYDWTRP